MIVKTGGNSAPIGTSLSPSALPVASTMEDVMAMSDASVAAGFQPVPMSEETNHTIDHMQEQQVRRAQFMKKGPPNKRSFFV